MAGFSLDISGVKQINDAIKRIDEKATKGLSDELATSVLNIQKSAIRLAPGDLGRLRGSIKFDISNALFKSVFSNVNYAPYIEFGTGRKVIVPPKYQEFAAQYKNVKPKGPVVSMYEAIKKWIKNKGIDPKLTYVIFRSIMRNGIKPQPFMIPAYEAEKPKLIKRLKNLFK